MALCHGLSDRLDMGNRFDLLRLAAALAVFAAHGEFLYRLKLPVPFPGHSLGSLAVYVFFFISGYLVCQSWMRDPVWGAFWLKRLMRVFPGLIVSVVFSVFVLGWAVTTLEAADYFSAPATWRNFFNNAAGLATVQTLPGVFETNPFAKAVNGSLWTIRYELAMYLVLVLVALCGQGRRWAHPLVAAVLAVLWQVASAAGWDASLSASRSLFAEVFRWRDFCAFGVPFFAGSTLAIYSVRPQAWMMAVAVAGFACAWGAMDAWVRQMAVWIGVSCGIFYIAHVGAHAAGILRWRADLSYGVYIYAFPVQQAVTEHGLRVGWGLAWCLSVSLALILTLAVLSWYGVERPCILAAQRYLKRDAARHGAKTKPATSS